MNQATVRNNPDPRQQVLSAVQAADSVLLFLPMSRLWRYAGQRGWRSNCV